MGSLVVPPRSLYKFPVNISPRHKTDQGKKNRKSRDVYSRQDRPEDFWKSHIRRHHSSLNLIDECINQNVTFLSSRLGHFSSLEDLSSRVYNERREARYYVQPDLEPLTLKALQSDQPRLFSSRGAKKFRKFLSGKSKTSKSDERKVSYYRKSKTNGDPEQPPCQHLCLLSRK